MLINCPTGAQHCRLPEQVPVAAGRGSGRKQCCDHVSGLSVSLGRVRWVPLALRRCMGARGFFEWKLGGIWSLSFGVCLNEGQGMLHWKHRESVRHPSAEYSSAAWYYAEDLAIECVWPWAVGLLSSALKPSFRADIPKLLCDAHVAYSITCNEK